MEDSATFTPYDEMMQTRDVQILKTIVPFVEYRAQRQLAMLIQYLEYQHIKKLFSSRENSIAICEIPDNTDRRTAMLSAVRKYCTPKEQETIDTLLNMFCIMEQIT